MSKAAKTRAADQRKKLKRGKKAAQQALYESYKARGSNQKKKTGRGDTDKVNTTKHLIGFCGNHGCEKCYREYAAPRMNDSTDPRVRFRTTDDMRKLGFLT